MFSIARYTGESDDESTKDIRTYEKKKERLDSLNARIKKQKRKEDFDIDPTKDSKKIKTDKGEKARETETSVEATDKDTNNGSEEQIDQGSGSEENIAETDIGVADETTDEDEDESEGSASDNDIQNDEDNNMDVDNDDGETAEQLNEESNVPTLEAFPEMILPKNKRSREEKKLLRQMGIPEWILQPTVISPKASCELDKVGLSSHIVQRCQDVGLSSLFAVQMATVPVFLRRRHTLYDTRSVPGDLCISAPTGSGKTLAYVLPIVDILSAKRIVTRLRAVVVLPTRDLVTQVKETFDAFVKGTNLSVAATSGQQSFAHEQQVLVGNTDERYPGGKSRVDILITTPGRLIDHLSSTPNFTLQHLRFLVIDEADRLLNQSYNDWLNQILLATRPSTSSTTSIESDEHNDLRLPDVEFKKDVHGVYEADAIAPSYLRSNYNLPSTDLDLPKMSSVQKLLFSATLTKNPAKIAELHLNNPEYISVQNEDGSETTEEYTTPEGLKEYMTVCSTEKKPLMVLYLLHQLGLRSGLCFTRSVESTQKLQTLIEAFEQTQPEDQRIRVKDYSSELGPAQRKQMLKQFKQGQIDLLICSDLIGRGIDLDSVQFVISYDVPHYMDKYIHRVGRTARAGREGEAYTLVEKQEARHFKQMLRQAGHLNQVKALTVDKEKLDELTPAYQKVIDEFGSEQ